MAFYNFVCDQHDDQTAEIRCEHSSLEERKPRCPACGEFMVRDYGAELFGGIVNRSKGIYPLDDDGISPTGEIVRINDAQHHKRLMKEYGLAHHQRSAESHYSRKHVRDRTGG